jgi:hypothetical protein
MTKIVRAGGANLKQGASPPRPVELFLPGSERSGVLAERYVATTFDMAYPYARVDLVSCGRGASGEPVLCDGGIISGEGIHEAGAIVIETDTERVLIQGGVAFTRELEDGSDKPHVDIDALSPSIYRPFVYMGESLQLLVVENGVQRYKNMGSIQRVTLIESRPFVAGDVTRASVRDEGYDEVTSEMLGGLFEDQVRLTKTDLDMINSGDKGLADWRAVQLSGVNGRSEYEKTVERLVEQMDELCIEATSASNQPVGSEVLFDSGIFNSYSNMEAIEAKMAAETFVSRLSSEHGAQTSRWPIVRRVEDLGGEIRVLEIQRLPYGNSGAHVRSIRKVVDANHQAVDRLLSVEVLW